MQKVREELEKAMSWIRKEADDFYNEQLKNIPKIWLNVTKMISLFSGSKEINASSDR